MKCELHTDIAKGKRFACLQQKLHFYLFVIVNLYLIYGWFLCLPLKVKILVLLQYNYTWSGWRNDNTSLGNVWTGSLVYQTLWSVTNHKVSKKRLIWDFTATPKNKTDTWLCWLRLHESPCKVLLKQAPCAKPAAAECEMRFACQVSLNLPSKI